MCVEERYYHLLDLRNGFLQLLDLRFDLVGGAALEIVHASLHRLEVCLGTLQTAL